MANTDTLFWSFRGACGLSLLVCGLGFLVEPAAQKITRVTGVFLACSGLLWIFSWSSQFGLLPLPLDNLLLLVLVYGLSLAVFELGLYLLGDTVNTGTRKKVYIAGALWYGLFWILACLDGMLTLPAVTVSVEDGRAMGPFQTAFFIAINLWPLLTAGLALASSRWALQDLGHSMGSILWLEGGLATIMCSLILITLGSALGISPLYRGGHILIQLALILFAIYLRARPDAINIARRQVGTQFEARRQKTRVDVALVEARMAPLLTQERFICNPDLNLGSLAQRLDLPVYRLSQYFNSYRGITFTTWLNDQRIELAKTKLREHPDLSVLDIAMQVGYSSKTTFNAQFLRRGGLSPREFRQLNSQEKRTD